MNWLRISLPYLVLLVGLMVVAREYRGNAETSGGKVGFDYDALAQTLVMDDGRAKPLDSVARNTLLMLYEKQRFTHEGEDVDAIAWMMDVIARPQVAHNYKVFRVDHADLLELGGLRPSDGYDDKFFSYNQLLPLWSELTERVPAIGDDGPETPYERAMVDVFSKLRLYQQFISNNRPL